ncbi:hypothetical protein [Granulicella sibirica]|uniref:DUF6841 domain-containing protein n=1 Tax=Granulicella sibirica TaxID=2479048 RepID=A0A4Q0T0Q7_9BACT|nr:hypothetical protein [Granulicella sibirica]RXH57183.1 hypothetical protein GRAN_0493 [Granulicella sibirica]
MTTLTSIRDEIDQWFTEYFNAFIAIGAGKMNPERILLYWGIPLHTSSPKHAKWLNTPQEVVAVLNEMQEVLKKIGYTHTEALDKTITTYNENASRVETIMSRRGSDGAEVDRAAVSFELRRAGNGWIIISTAARPTEATELDKVW